MVVTLDAPESLTADPPAAVESQSAPTLEEVLLESDGAETEVDATEAPEADASPATVSPAEHSATEPAQVEPSEIPEEERRFWAQLAVLSKITDCTRGIEEEEKAIEDLKNEIKERRDLLKGEAIRLRRLGSELADIMDGKPLPKPPKALEQPASDATQSQASESVEDQEEEQDDASWRTKPTSELLKGLKGLGKKKLEALIDVAPTAGDLEDLRGEASKTHENFSAALPDGFGDKIASSIEDRLIEHVAKCSPSAEQQAAAEREKLEAEEEEPEEETAEASSDEQLGKQEPMETDEQPRGELDPELMKSLTSIREKIERSKADGRPREQFIPTVEDGNDLELEGYEAHKGGAPVTECPKVNGGYQKRWLAGWVCLQIVSDWDEKSETDS